MEIIPRHILGHGRELLANFPVVVIQGARQVGKSTLANLLVEKGPGIQVTLDDTATLAALRHDPDTFLTQAGDGTLVIDEAQLDPELPRAIKKLVDRDRRPGRFLLTGSANLLRTRSATDSLAGRAVTLRLRGLSQGEIHHQHDDFVTALLESSAPASITTELTRLDYIQALSTGGFPEMQRRLNTRMTQAWLSSYLERILDRDAPLVSRGSATERLATLTRLLAAAQGEELVKARLAEQASIPQGTITGYLDALEAIFLTEKLKPWTANLTTREIGRPKISISDPALALRLAETPPSQLASLRSEVFGHHLEAFVVSELLKQQGWSETEFTLSHFRDRNGLEVDIVIELADGSVIAVEVKASASHRPDHFRNLLKLEELLGARFRRGVVLNTAPGGFQFSRTCVALPVAALWELT
ncbi:MAG: ATP-binding protein [Arachnia propionica]|uniref:ATP-binding protein n=1 Tax=Arachnia propionica TaxID=1750 RepID=UPI0026FD6341|nr:ATP-binding protein [Arachnia propionica]